MLQQLAPQVTPSLFGLILSRVCWPFSHRAFSHDPHLPSLPWGEEAAGKGPECAFS